MERTLRTAFTAVATVVITTGAAWAQPAPPAAAPAAPCTIWSFMGIPQGLNKVHGAMFNRHGLLPCLEKKPPLKALADPANLESENAAIKRAAQIKKEEDLKPQKIKAIKYLAKIGCGCYDKDGSVTEALLKAMDSVDECTEEVRLAAVEAVSTAASGEECANCKQRSCCNEKILTKLAEIAYYRTDNGCYKEPSERVRAAAVDALHVCCTSAGPPIIEEGTEPTPKPAEPRPSEPEPVASGDPAPVPPRQTLSGSGDDSQYVSSRRTAHRFASARAKAQVADADGPGDMPSTGEETLDPASNRVSILVDLAHQRAEVILPRGAAVLPVGSRLAVHDPKDGPEHAFGNLEVVAVKPGAMVVRPSKGLDLSRIGAGTVVVPAR